MQILWMYQFSSVQSLSHVWFFVTPWTAACQASLSSTISQSLLRFMCIESVMFSNHLILCHLLLLLPSVFASIKVFSNEPALHTRRPKYWSFIFGISLSNEYWGCGGVQKGRDFYSVGWRWEKSGKVFSHVLQLGIERMPPAVEMQSFNHWTTKEVPGKVSLRGVSRARARTGRGLPELEEHSSQGGA